MIGLWSERRLRRDIIARLKSLFDVSLAREGEQVRTQWASDYGLGFISMLVLRSALRAQPDLESEALGRLQIDCWADLTGIDPAEVGTRITLLSAGRDSRFGEGCRAALRFDSAVDHNDLSPEFDLMRDARGAALDPESLRQTLWLQAWQGG